MSAIYTNVPSTVVSSGGGTNPAAGTQETWTVISSASFPAASTAAGTFFHISDPVLPAEIIKVTNVSGSTWTVIRGDEVTVPVTHQAGFTVNQVVSAGELNFLSGLAPSGDQTGATDYANITALVNLGVTKVRLQIGQFWVNHPVILQDYTWIEGSGDELTIVSPANAANCDVFQGVNFSSLTNTGTVTVTGAGPRSVQISNLTIDGNIANQTLTALTNAACVPSTAPAAGYGIRLYGRDWRVFNIAVRNCFAYGLWTEWGTGPSNSVYQNDSVEGRAVNVKVYDNGVHGWYHRGPTDCQFVNTVCYQNNSFALNAGIDFWAESDNVTNGSGTSHFSPNGLQLVNCHFWGTTAKWNLVLDADVSAANCHAEGAAIGCALFRGPVRWTGGSTYYIPGQVSSWGCNVQFGDAGTTTGVPTTALYTANVTFIGKIAGALADVPARAGIVWASANQSLVDAQFIVRSAPTATVAAGSNTVAVSTFTGTGTLSFSGGTGMPPAGGTLTVATSTGTATITYTGYSGGAFTGCNTTAGTGTLSTGGAITLANTGTVAVTGTVDGASYVDIEVNGSGLAPGVVETSSLHFAKGRHRLDVGTGNLQYSLTNAGTDAFYVNTNSKNFGAPNGYIFRLYSDNYATQTFNIDGARTHFTPNGPNPAITVVSNAGTGAPAPTVSGLSNDMKGSVSMGTGTTPTTGQQATITFANAYVNTPIIVLTSGTIGTPAVQPYVSGASSTGFSIAFAVAPAASQTLGTYQVTYVVMGA